MQTQEDKARQKCSRAAGAQRNDNEHREADEGDNDGGDGQEDEGDGQPLQAVDFEPHHQAEEEGRDDSPEGVNSLYNLSSPHGSHNFNQSDSILPPLPLSESFGMTQKMANEPTKPDGGDSSSEVSDSSCDLFDSDNNKDDNADESLLRSSSEDDN